MYIIIPSTCLITLLLLGCTNDPPQEELHTRSLLNRITIETKMMVIDDGALPTGDLADLVQTLNRTGTQAYLAERRISYPGIDCGKDAWGRRILLEIDPAGVIKLRSKGADGIDDHGKGDDIERVIDCRKYIRKPPQEGLSVRCRSELKRAGVFLAVRRSFACPPY